MRVKFEHACQNDAEKLVDIQNRCFYEDYIEYGECPGYNIEVGKMKENILNSLVYKILFNDQIIGDIIVRELGNGKYYLGGICVLPEFHNLGIGKKAIQYIEKENNDAKMWELETPSNRYKNHYFYSKMGYKKFNEYLHSERLTLYKFRKEIEG